MLIILTVAFCSGCVLSAQEQDLSFYVRFKVTKPAIGKVRVLTSGYRHEGAPWRFPIVKTELDADEWSEWINLTDWNWHGKIYRAGGARGISVDQSVGI